MLRGALAGTLPLSQTLLWSERDSNSRSHPRSAVSFALRLRGSLRQTPVVARFPLPAANGRCGFGEATFATTHGKGQDAPIAAVGRVP